MIIERKFGKVYLKTDIKSFKISNHEALVLLKKAPYVSTCQYTNINCDQYGDVGIKTIFHLQPVGTDVIRSVHVEIPDYTPLPLITRIRMTFH